MAAGASGGGLLPVVPGVGPDRLRGAHRDGGGDRAGRERRQRQRGP